MLLNAFTTPGCPLMADSALFPRFRKRHTLFGILHNHPMLEAEGVALIINGKNSEIDLKDLSTGNLLQTLGYHSLSGDWAAASFSEDGSIIAVAEPYYITFFSRVSVV